MVRKKICLIFLTAILNLTGCITVNTPIDPPQSVPVINPSVKDIATTSATAMPQQITLFVPLQGALADTGQAIRDGFMMAYQMMPTEERPVKINVVDSSDAAQVQANYNQAIQQGTNFVIGPLAKANVQVIAQNNNVTVPTLALNYLDQGQAAPTQFYQFGLSPFDEVQQVSQLARRDGKQNAIIMVPEGAWGETIAQAYQTEWTKQGGNVRLTVTLSNTQAVLVQQIKQLAMHQRGKFDVILLTVAPTIARQIKPLFKFYHVDNIAIYATSMVYNATPQAQLNSDLDGVIFCDAPWAISAQPEAELYQKLADAYPANFQNRAKYYGLGVDAYHIALQLNAMLQVQKAINGATGNLSFDDQHRIVRQLPCTQIKAGMPILLSTQ